MVLRAIHGLLEARRDRRELPPRVLSPADLDLASHTPLTAITGSYAV